MKTHFLIHHGELSIEDNYIQINDNNPKWIKFLAVFGSICAILYGILIIIKYFKTNDPFDLWPGIIIVTLGIPALIVQTRINYDKQLYFNDIERVIIKHNISNYFFADFMLSNGRKRRVMLDQNELGKFEKYFLDDFVKALNDKNLKTEIK
ncbi:MAG: hypothetical protein MUO72_01285 [Bacteroidales bacterium]|nr:hypothetical protein [Bacteroidales bacterium]